MLATAETCPVCGSQLVNMGDSYSLDALFALWLPVHFTEATVEEHRKQSDSTSRFECPNCKLEVFLPQIVATPAFYVEAYNLDGSQEVSEFTYSYDKWDFREAARDTQAGMKIIEFGCGSGAFLEKLRNAGVQGVGIEYNDAAIQAATAKGIDVYPSVDAAGTAAESCDAAFAFHVLEHVASPVEFVEAMAKSVRTDGLIGISVPNQDGPISYINPCIMNMPPHHATRWRLDSFRALSSRLNLSIVRVDYEPLLVENHSYYSVSWVRSRFTGESTLVKGTRAIVTFALKAFFKAIAAVGVREFPLLRGQAIYVLMRKA